MKILRELTPFQFNANLQNLETKVLGKHYIYYKEIDSTQKEVWRRIDSNEIVDGMLIRTEKQTDGIGTHGRTWYTREKNIAFSFYMKLNCKVSRIDGLTIQIAETIADIIKERYNILLEIKPPNDLYVNGKKIGGILTQTRLSGDNVKFLVVGIGINNSQINFEKEIENIATSFKKEFGIVIDIESFLTEFCNKIEQVILKRIEG